MATSNLKMHDREFILEFIQQYRNLPSLWNVKCKDYYDRDKKNNDYNLLTDKYIEMYPNATIIDVKKKINSLRSNYRKKLRQYHHASETGDDKLKYKCEPWYFSALSFLQDHESLDDSQVSEIDIDGSEFQNQNSASSDDDFLKVVVIRSNTNTPQSCTSSITPERQIKSKLKSMEEEVKREGKKRRKGERGDQENMTCKCNKEVNNYNHWALACAADLQRMDPTQQIYAKRAIAEIIMEGSLGLLHRNSVKVNDLAVEQYTDPLLISSTQKNIKHCNQTF